MRDWKRCSGYAKMHGYAEHVCLYTGTATPPGAVCPGAVCGLPGAVVLLSCCTCGRDVQARQRGGGAGCNVGLADDAVRPARAERSPGREREAHADRPRSGAGGCLAHMWLRLDIPAHHSEACHHDVGVQLGYEDAPRSTSEVSPNRSLRHNACAGLSVPCARRQDWQKLPTQDAAMLGEHQYIDVPAGSCLFGCSARTSTRVLGDLVQSSLCNLLVCFRFKKLLGSRRCTRLCACTSERQTCCTKVLSGR